MKIDLVNLDYLLLGGMSFYGDPISTKGGWEEENEIGKTWKRFMEFIAENPVRPYSVQGHYVYEVHVYNHETPTKGYFEVFVGEEVNSKELPIALGSKFIDSSEYLKITLVGKEIISDWWKKLDTEIIPSRSLRRNHNYIIQAYDERFKGMDNIEDSEIDAFIPVGRI